MQSASSPVPIPIPGLKIPPLPEVDLGVPLRHSAKAKLAVGDGMKASFVMGAGHGYSIGQTIGYAGGHAVGVVEGVVIGCVCTGSSLFVLFLVVAVMVRCFRR